MGELTFWQVLWGICQVCIIVVIAICAIVATIWWIIKAFEDKGRIATHKNIARENADAADIWLNKYYAEREAHESTKEYYKRQLRQKERDVAAMLEWDDKRLKRIEQLEKQLRDNGIEPDKFDMEA